MDIGYDKFKWLLKTYLFGCWDRGALWLFVWIAPLKIYILTYLTCCAINNMLGDSVDVAEIWWVGRESGFSTRCCQHTSRLRYSHTEFPESFRFSFCLLLSLYLTGKVCILGAFGFPVCTAFLVSTVLKIGLHIIMHRTIGLKGHIIPLTLTLTLVHSSVTPIVR